MNLFRYKTRADLDIKPTLRQEIIRDYFSLQLFEMSPRDVRKKTDDFCEEKNTLLKEIFG